MELGRREAQSLVEVLIGIALGALLIVAGATLIVPALRTNQQVSNIQAQTELAKELSDNVKAWAGGNWNNILSVATGSAHAYYLFATSSPFAATSGIETVVLGSTSYNRYFYVNDMYRDGSGNATSSTAVGNSYDPSTKQVVAVTRVVSSTNAATTTFMMYLTRNANSGVDQTDWSGGSGAGGPATLVGNQFASSTSNVVYNSPAGSLTLQPSYGLRATSPPFVQETMISDDSDAPSSSAVFSLNNTAGDLVVLALAWNNNVVTLPTINDAKGNAYSWATTGQSYAGGTVYIAISYAPNIKAGANAVTVNWAASATHKHLAAIEYSGVTAVATSALDVAAYNAQPSAPPDNGVDGITSGNIATASSSDLIFAVTVRTDDGSPTISAGTAFTPRLLAQVNSLMVEDLVQASAGSIAGTFTYSTSQQALTAVAAFRPVP